MTGIGMAHHQQHRRQYRHSTSVVGGKHRAARTAKPSPSACLKIKTASLWFVSILAMRQDDDVAQLHQCHAFAHSPTTSTSTPHLPTHANKITSRKSDGQYTVYTFDTKLSGRENDVGILGERDGVEMEVSKEHGIRHPFSSALNRFQYALRSTFLPSLPNGSQQKGDDNSNDNNLHHQIDKLRSTNYLRYIFYDNIQDLSTSLRSVLATQRILHGVGVGRSGATALSATINFLIRDGCGMAASLLFTSYVSHSFRRNVKRWKYFADIMVDFGITLEIVAPSVLTIPFMHGWFLPLLCLGNVCKALCGVAAGACGGALQMYWAVKVMGTEEGISEVAAKSGAQRTFVGGIGLVLSAFLAKWLGNGDVSTAFGLYFLLTAIHLFCNYQALKLVALDWLNGWRLNHIVMEFLKCIEDTEDRVDEKLASGLPVVSNPVELSRTEPLIFLPGLLSKKQMSSTYPIRMGVSFNELCQHSYLPQSMLQSHIVKLQNQRADSYILSVGHVKERIQTKRCILISFFSRSTNVEKAKAYLHGCLVRRTLVSLEANGKEEQHLLSDEEMVQKAETLARNELARLWPKFEWCVAIAGWKLDKTECSTEGYEIYFQ